MKRLEIYKKIYRIIKDYDEIVLARHISPDPDAISSQVALREAIKLTFPKKKVYAVGASVHRFKFIGSLDKVDYSTLSKPLLIVLDVPNFVRVDGIDNLKYDAILKIDHHPEEDIHGNVNWCDPDKSSTCEMVANLIMNTRLKMNDKVASALYVGMVSDCERFLLKNTTIDTFNTAYNLLNKSKINFVPLYDNLYEKSFNEEKFHAYLINNIQISENGFGFIYVTNDVLKEYNVESTSVSNQVNDFYFIKELIAWMFVVYDEKQNIYKANLRSRGPIINTIANKYHGGGHKFASGCRADNYDVIEALAHDLDLECKKYNEENK